MEDKSSSQRNEDGGGSSFHSAGSRRHFFQEIWRSPLCIFGIVVATISFTLVLLGLLGDILGFLDNPYVGVYIYMILPAIGIFGVIILFGAAYFRHRRWQKSGTETVSLVIDLGNPRHRLWGLRLLILFVISFTALVVISYEGYHFSDSNYFCGLVCHRVMEPEYTVFQISSHARVPCVECHIGSGAEWYVRAKLSGLRQVMNYMTGSYHRPIPVPLENLRPARDTCEQCHWPEKFYGKKVKTFYHFSNDDQLDPEVNEIALHVGGPAPGTGDYVGIHWHVSNNIKVAYQPLNDDRTSVGAVRVTRADGSVEEFVRDDGNFKVDTVPAWKIMDCLDCHNRPSHRFALPDERVDFGLLSGIINPQIPGIREDSLTVLKNPYTRDEAQRLLVADLAALQADRGAETARQHEEDIVRAGEYLLRTYLTNIWPSMNIRWGVYRQHIGHGFKDDGIGCFRCHNDEHENDQGEVIPQDCDLCHEMP